MSRVLFLGFYLGVPLFFLLALAGVGNGIISYLSTPFAIHASIAFLCGLIAGWRFGMFAFLVLHFLLEPALWIISYL